MVPIDPNDRDALTDLQTATKFLNIPHRELAEDIKAGLLPALILGKQRSTIRVNLQELREAIAARIRASIAPAPSTDYTKVRWTHERCRKLQWCIEMMGLGLAYGNAKQARQWAALAGALGLEVRPVKPQPWDVTDKAERDLERSCGAEIVE
ncbi:MAG: hypothetical protein ACYC26_10150 [Phycisphaerales bacterium]